LDLRGGGLSKCPSNGTHAQLNLYSFGSLRLRLRLRFTSRVIDNW
jgi:hypothetical protein